MWQSQIALEPAVYEEDRDEYEDLNDTIVVQQWFIDHDILEVKPPS